MIQAAQSLYSFVKVFPVRFSRAYADCWNFVPEVPFKAHPIQNIYDKTLKKKDWPVELDKAMGYWKRSDLKPKSATVSYTKENVYPLHAVAHKISRIFKWVYWGADVNAADIRGQNPAYWASYHGQLKKLMILHSQKANLQQADNRGKTPIRAAAKYNQKWIITYLANAGCNLNVIDGRGLTPLHVASKKCHLSSYKRLIQLGADQTILDPLGRSAKDIYVLAYRKKYADTFFPIRVFIKTPEEMAQLI